MTGRQRETGKQLTATWQSAEFGGIDGINLFSTVTPPVLPLSFLVTPRLYQTYDLMLLKMSRCPDLIVIHSTL